LHIYDSSDWTIRWTAGRRGAGDRFGVPDYAGFTALFRRLMQAGRTFDRILFETHGAPGQIGFGHEGVDAGTLRSLRQNGFTTLARPGARIYFNGCNVADGPNGWAFLEAAADLFLNPGGGEIFGQTSLGFANPISGHVVHLWGNARRLFVGANGRVIERFEQ
jgi:hypothetical protein